MVDKILMTPRQKRPPKKITSDYLHNYALFYLERFASSVGNTRRILMNRVRKSIAHHGQPPMDQAKQWVEEELDKLVRVGLLNDDAYVRSMVNSYHRKGLSRRGITAKLMQKGIDSKFLDGIYVDWVEDNNVENAELEAALNYKRRKRLGQNSDNYQKDMASLARAGFSYDIVKRVLDMSE